MGATSSQAADLEEEERKIPVESTTTTDNVKIHLAQPLNSKDDSLKLPAEIGAKLADLIESDCGRPRGSVRLIHYTFWITRGTRPVGVASVTPVKHGDSRIEYFCVAHGPDRTADAARLMQAVVTAWKAEHAQSSRLRLLFVMPVSAPESQRQFFEHQGFVTQDKLLTGSNGIASAQMVLDLRGREQKEPKEPVPSSTTSTSTAASKVVGTSATNVQKLKAHRARPDNFPSGTLSRSKRRQLLALLKSWCGGTTLPGHTFWVTTSDGKVVALASLEMLPNGNVARLTNVCASPADRRKGYTKRLLSWMLDKWREMHDGEIHIYLEVREDNTAAESLYRSLGFRSLDVLRMRNGVQVTEMVLNES